MEWLNIHSSTLDSPEFIGSDPIDRGTWLCLLRFCIGQENGGRITQANEWSDRKWQQLVRVTKEETQHKTQLWQWDGADLVVNKYPLDKQLEVQGKRKGGSVKSDAKRNASRENGKAGGRPHKTDQTGTQQETQQEPNRNLNKGMEGKGREWKENGMEGGASLSPGGGEPAGFLLRDGQTWTAQSSLVDGMAKAYPDLDVAAEMRRAALWLHANPERRKTARGMPRFITLWMGRAGKSQHDSEKPDDSQEFMEVMGLKVRMKTADEIDALYKKMGIDDNVGRGDAQDQLRLDL